jgi:thiol-disulfide isomerase/thioredoxin
MTGTQTMMTRLILLLLICSPAIGQPQPQPVQNKYSFDDFMLIVKVEDQEKIYNQMLKELPADKTTPEATNDYRADLAYGWLAQGNVERYRYYKATHPKFSAAQLVYLCDALEKMADVKKQYAEVEQISRELLDELNEGRQHDGIGRTSVLMELNAVSNAMLGNIEVAKAMMAKSSDFPEVKNDGSDSSAGEIKGGIRNLKYFRDSKSSYLHRQAIVLSASGDHQGAFGLLSKAFREADSNPNMVGTFQEMYRKTKGTDEGFEPYLESLRAEAYRKYYEEVEKTYIATPQKTLKGTAEVPDPEANGGTRTITLFRAKRPVHDISILDLKGEPVHLGDYKGKILALDFWTTLCTPCVAAFSGFERVVADYKKADFQMFVVDLLESQATVKSYVAKKGITLDVLHDEESKAYDIGATPTKIVFDPEGNIRFYGGGYAGSTDREYYKLKSMIEITRARYSGGSDRPK